MKELIIKESESEQRLDKYLMRYLPDAPKNLIFKSLRKKNITLNGKKAEGNEKLRSGDSIRIFFTDETIAGFQKSFPAKPAVFLPEKGKTKKQASSGPASGNHLISQKVTVVYEDDRVLFLNKPCGLLSQKSVPSDYALTDFVSAYLGARNPDITFRPGISNRLDRNTSGLVLTGKTHRAVAALDDLIKNRRIKKEYLTLVKGVMEQPLTISGYLVKNRKTNTVEILINLPQDAENAGEAWPIRTAFTPLAQNGRETLLLVDLITGKSHQIRAHLASMNHPIAGDAKYGNPKYNRFYKENYHLEHQLLHAWRVTFPDDLPESLREIAGQSFCAPLPPGFSQILAGQKLECPGEMGLCVSDQ